jgi:HEAT repeat protein
MDHIPESITHLIDDLQSEDEFARAQAAFALSMLGEPAVEPLISQLSHADRDVRMRAAWALGVIGEGRALNQLFHGLTDPDPRVAQRAATALGKIGDPRAFHPLLTALHHPAPDVRYAVCNALGHLHVADATAALEDLASTDTGATSWGAPVADAARRAKQEIASARPRAADSEFAQLSALLQNQRNQE